MKVIYENAACPIETKDRALTLSGISFAPDNMNALYDSAVSAVLSICGRNDISIDMELPLSIILSGMIQDGVGRPISAVKRGDVAITYTMHDYAYAKELLSPFIRLRSVQ